MRFESLSYSLSEWENNEEPRELVRDQSGLYMWSLRPHFNNLEKIAPLMNSMVYNRIIEGRDRYSRRSITISIESESLTPQSDKWNVSNLDNNKDGLNFLSFAGNLLSPPIYIGKAWRNLDGRTDNHVRDIKSVFGADSWNSSTSFSQRISDWHQSLKKMKIHLSPSDFGVTFMILSAGSTVSESDLLTIENLLINTVGPIGNFDLKK